MRTVIALAGMGAATLGAIVASCGGSTNDASSVADAAADGTSPLHDGQAEDVTSSDASGATSDGGGDAGSPACAPPSDPTKSAVCITIQPETIAFLAADPKLDGKGTLVVQAFDLAVPDLADGGTAPALATVVLPGADAGAGSLDLSAPVPVVRIDGLPTTVYLRAIFADDPLPPKGLAPGDWLAGYDLAAGLYQGVPLKGESLTPGQGTPVSLEMRALRQMTVTLSLATAPVGNAQGPSEVFAVDSVLIGKGARVFGLGKSTCASVADGGTADVVGFVVGKGPYYVTGWIDDFGTYPGGTLLSPGALAALEVEADGGAQIPVANQVTYAADAYTVAKAIPLGLVVAGDAGTDGVSCP